MTLSDRIRTAALSKRHLIAPAVFCSWAGIRPASEEHRALMAYIGHDPEWYGEDESLNDRRMALLFVAEALES